LGLSCILKSPLFYFRDKSPGSHTLHAVNLEIVAELTLYLRAMSASVSPWFRRLRRPGALKYFGRVPPLFGGREHKIQVARVARRMVDMLWS
jgi:hypothetical protein